MIYFNLILYTYFFKTFFYKFLGGSGPLDNARTIPEWLRGGGMFLKKNTTWFEKIRKSGGKRTKSGQITSLTLVLQWWPEDEVNMATFQHFGSWIRMSILFNPIFWFSSVRLLSSRSQRISHNIVCFSKQPVENLQCALTYTKNNGWTTKDGRVISRNWFQRIEDAVPISYHRQLAVIPRVKHNWP